MSKHVRVPAPIKNVLPSIIRSTGARFILLGTASAAVLALGGSHFLLSHSTVTPTPHKATPAAATANAQVLGSSTSDHANTAPPAQATTPTTAPIQPVTAAPAAQPATPVATEHSAGSFDLAVDTAKITQQGITVLVPFSVVRHGGLSTAIVPGNVSITIGGVLSNLVTIQSETMTSPDSGLITLLPVGLGSGEMNVHFSASSGSAMASTSFTYKLKR